MLKESGTIILKTFIFISEPTRYNKEAIKIVLLNSNFKFAAIPRTKPINTAGRERTVAKTRLSMKLLPENTEKIIGTTNAVDEEANTYP